MNRKFESNNREKKISQGTFILIHPQLRCKYGYYKECFINKPILEYIFNILEIEIQLKIYSTMRSLYVYYTFLILCIQLFQGRVTTASNVWTFGITAWEILTLCHQRPFSMLTDIGKKFIRLWTRLLISFCDILDRIILT